MLHIQPVTGVQVTQSNRVVYTQQFQKHFVRGIHVALLVAKQSSQRGKS